MDEIDPDIEAAREALKNLATVRRKSRKTVQTVIKALLPEIEERLKTHSAEEVIPAVELALGKKIPNPTFFSALCRVRKEVYGK